MLPYFPGHKERSGQIQPYNLIPFLQRHILRCSSRCHSCIIHQNVYLPIVGYHLIYHFNNLFFLRNITLHRQTLSTVILEFFRQLFQAIHPPGHNRQFGALPRESLGHLYSKSRRSAGDQRHLPCQIK